MELCQVCFLPRSYGFGIGGEYAAINSAIDEQLAAEIMGGAGYTVFVHSSKRLRGLMPPSSLALPREPYPNVPRVARFYPDRAAKEHSRDP